MLDREEEVRLSKLIRRGDERALDQLVRSNLRFVVHISKKFVGQGVDASDLVNEGNLGLLRAARSFDGSKGVRFASYAAWWIRQSILEALAAQSRIMKVPIRRAMALRRLKRCRVTLRARRGRNPSIEEMAENLSWSRRMVESTLLLSLPAVSLDAPACPGDVSSLMDYIPDQLSPSPEEDTFERALTETLRDQLSTIPKREARVLRLVFGLDGKPPMLMKDIGRLLGVTAERIRQIKVRALQRLRHPSRARFLETFWGDGR